MEMDKTQDISRYPRALRQWIFDNLNFMDDENERHSISYLIMDHFFGIDRTGLAMNKSQHFSAGKLDKMKVVIGRLNNHEPIQYILGEADFYGRKFYVDPNVLIPRAETEVLVDLIVKESHMGQPNILDIGTGSGCIAINLKLELSGASVTGVDIEEKALQCAMKNGARYGADIDWGQVDILADKLSPLSYDIVVSNPPYVRESERALMLKNVIDYEPHSALFVSDRDPLMFYRAIAGKAYDALRDGGKIYLEINEAFGEEVVNLLKKEGFEKVRVIGDLQQKDRIVKAIKVDISPGKA